LLCALLVSWFFFFPSPFPPTRRSTFSSAAVPPPRHPSSNCQSSLEVKPFCLLLILCGILVVFHCTVALSSPCSVVCSSYTYIQNYFSNNLVFSVPFRVNLCGRLTLFDCLTFRSCRFTQHLSMTIRFRPISFDFSSTSHKSIYVYIRIGARIGTVQNKSQGLNKIGVFPFCRQAEY